MQRVLSLPAGAFNCFHQSYFNCAYVRREYSIIPTLKLFCFDLIFVLANDHPLQVDGVNIQGYTNQQAVEVLRHTGQTVHLKLIRRGFRPDEIPPAVTPSVTILPPSTTIPPTTTVMRELELEKTKTEEAVEGRKEEFNVVTGKL